MLRRNLNDWEMDELGGLLKVLMVYSLAPKRCDGWRWTLNKKGIYTAKCMYCILVNDCKISFPHNDIWKPGIPSKVSFFLWNTYLDKILTPNYLQSRWWNLANRCIMCMREEESVNHLFMFYPIASKVWDFFLSSFHISWVLPKYFSKLIKG